MDGFDTITVEEATEAIIDYRGKTPPKTASGIQLITAKVIKGGRILEEPKEYIATDYYDGWMRRGLPQRLDVLITTEAPLGEVAILRRDSKIALAQRVILLRARRGKVDPVYLFYALQSEFAQGELRRRATGTTVAGIKQSELRRIRVPIFNVNIQRRIADILSPYDELAENCLHRIRVIEEMARTLYRAWFVHFRFPGHKTVSAIDVTNGTIPRGLERIRFECLLTSMTGGDWGSDQRNDVETCEVTVVRGTDLDEVAYGGRLRAPVRYIKPSSLITRGLRLGDVVVENSINAKCRCVGTSLVMDRHNLSRLGSDAIAASFCKVFRLRSPELAPLVHLHLRHLRETKRMEYYQNVAANGIANFQAQKFAKEEHLILPTDESIRCKLLEQLGALSAAISVLASKVSKLRRIRDLLLSRLLSGEISLDVAATAYAAESPASALLYHTDVTTEEITLGVAEEPPPYRVKRNGEGSPPSSELAAESAVPIDESDRTEVLQVIRKVFSEGPLRKRDTAIRDVARALGYRRTGARIHAVLHTDLLTAVRRGILESIDGELRLLTRSITDYERDFLKQQFLAAIGRPWIDRDDAIRDFCRWLGFARTGQNIEDTARSLINGLLRDGRLEADGAEMIRRI